METVYLTKEGYEKLKKELEYLKNVKRKEIIKAIEYARSLGDLRENVEYRAAKEEQALNERRIMELEQKLAGAQILDEEKIKVDKVYLGTKVTLLNLDTKEVIEYRLVSAEEAEPEKGAISIRSPVAKALLGHREGEEVHVNTPSTTIKYKIVKISK